MIAPKTIRITLSCVDSRGQLLEASDEVPWPESSEGLRIVEITAPVFTRLYSGVVNGTVPWKKPT